MWDELNSAGEVEWCTSIVRSSNGMEVMVTVGRGTGKALCANGKLASSPGPIFILKLAGTKNRAWYPLSRSRCACASHSPESGDSCTVVIWFVILSVK